MKSMRNLSTLWRPVRFLVAVCVCALILFSYSLPAYSLPNPFSSNTSTATSSPTDGEDNLTQIEKEAQDITARSETATPKQQESIKKTNPGINEVQGTADAEKMKRPENTTSTSVEEMVGKAVENMKGKD
ncbi:MULTISPECIES: low temperature-induced protein [unclassified Coleofasciculus]|uniref:low temperature-induced protein n=1 Tax=unclassified Coleofasciculus TaxID=2692782 RepID=UPI00188014B8|nr:MULTISPECIES: low temperature-induced protein [unclassified Coleofasciculus]MBE9126348.1 low temperature-induced protein [Coleofasciculus sp. LEGE 07081]MBE9147475.1 low temperature-induced protein [Coleofasciculus sp. LEGE 07092]